MAKTITQVIQDGEIVSETIGDDGQPWVMAPADFIGLFTIAEQDAIEASAHAIGKAARRTMFTVREVRGDDPLLAALMGGLVQLGILSEARAARILAGLPPE